MNSTNFPSFDLHGQVALVTGAARGMVTPARWLWHTQARM